MSNLKTALQFGELNQLRNRLAELDQTKRRQKLVENEKRYTSWLMDAFPGHPSLATLPSLVRGFARERCNYDIEMFEILAPLGSGWRTQEMPPLVLHHQPFAPERISLTLERFFEWTGDQAFAELHPIEQTTLSQARLLEIAPFACLNVPLIGTMSCFWLLRGGFVLPLWEQHQPGKYEEFLDSAFRLEMQPLIDYLRRGERRAIQAILRR